jgi:hypothetical protein
MMMKTPTQIGPMEAFNLHIDCVVLFVALLQVRQGSGSVVDREEKLLHSLQLRKCRTGTGGKWVDEVLFISLAEEYLGRSKEQRGYAQVVSKGTGL